MRLRSRLLLLIALLVSAALAASFAFIFRAVRAQALADLERITGLTFPHVAAEPA